MDQRILAAILFLWAGVATDGAAETPKARDPNAAKTDWRFSDWRTLGDRKVRVGFINWGSQTILCLYLSKTGNPKPIPLSKVKLAVSDIKGKPISVEPKYAYAYFLGEGDDQMGGMFVVGSPVQRLQPKDISAVSVTGFSGATKVLFVEGNAQEDVPPK